MVVVENGGGDSVDRSRERLRGVRCGVDEFDCLVICSELLLVVVSESDCGGGGGGEEEDEDGGDEGDGEGDDEFEVANDVFVLAWVLSDSG